MEQSAQNSLDVRIRSQYRRTLVMSLGMFLLVLVVTLSLTLFIDRQFIVNAERVSKADFDTNVSGAIDTFSNNFDDYVSALKAIAGFIESSEKVEEGEWNSFLADLDLNTSYPGFASINYGPIIYATQSAKFVNQLRLDKTFPNPVYRNFSISPATDQAWLNPIVYITPLETRESLIGFDRLSDPVRFESIMTAIDTGMPSSTEIIDLDTKGTKGFAIYTPVFRPNTVHDTPESRRANIEGLVSARFSLDHSFAELLPNIPPFDSLDIHIYAQPISQTIDSSKLLFDSLPPKEEYGDVYFDPSNSWHNRVEIRVAGQPWTVDLWALKVSEFSKETGLTPALFLYGGLSFSVLFSLLVGILMYSRISGYRLAIKLTRELEASRKSITLLINNLRGAAFRQINDSEMTFLYVSQGISNLTGHVPSEFSSGQVKFGRLILAEDYQKVIETTKTAILEKKNFTVDFRIRADDGMIKWLRGSVQPVFKESGELSYLEGFYFDITDQKQSEQQLESKAKELEKLNMLLVGREKKMVELKTLISKLEKKNHG